MSRPKIILKPVDINLTTAVVTTNKRMINIIGNVFHIGNYSSSQGGHAGLTWLRENARIFHDYTGLQGLIGETISSDDTGIDDVGPNSIDGSPLNSITVGNYLINDKPIACINDINDDCINIGQSLVNHLKDDFEFAIIFQTEDFITGASSNFIGAITNNTQGSRQKFLIFIRNDGKLAMQYAAGGGQVRWVSTNAVAADGVSGVLEIRVKVNFTAGTLTATLYDFGTETESNIAGAFEEGGADDLDLSEVDPSGLNLTHDIYIGSANNAGTALTNTNRVRIFRVAITELDPPAEAIEYFRDLDLDALWESQFHVTASNAATKRAEIIDYVFNGNGLPTNATPDSITPVTEGTIHGIAVANLLGFDSIDDLVFTMDDEDGETWTHHVYHIKNALPNGKIVGVGLGHSDIGDELTLNNYLAQGYDILWWAMPTTGDNEEASDNTTTSEIPDTTNNHNEIFTGGVDSATFNAIELFFFDKIQAINYVLANFEYPDIHAVHGVSGGGWTAAHLGAMDTRIQRTFPIRGVVPRIYKTQPFVAGNYEPDFEQAGANGLFANCGQKEYNFKTNYTYEDLLALCTTDGRVAYLITHENDSANGLGGTCINTFKTKMEQLAASLGGQYKSYLNTDADEVTHAVYQSEIDVVLEELGASSY